MNVPLDVLEIIASYFVKPQIGLSRKIPLNKLTYIYNIAEADTEYILQSNEGFNWNCLPDKYNAIHLISADSHTIKWNWVTRNKRMQEYFVVAFYEFHWNDTNTIYSLENYRHRINWDMFIKDPKLFEPDDILTKEIIIDNAIILDKIIN